MLSASSCRVKRYHRLSNLEGKNIRTECMCTIFIGSWNYPAFLQPVSPGEKRGKFQNPVKKSCISMSFWYFSPLIVDKKDHDVNCLSKTWIYLTPFVCTDRIFDSRPLHTLNLDPCLPRFRPYGLTQKLNFWFPSKLISCLIIDIKLHEKLKSYDILVISFVFLGL